MANGNDWIESLKAGDLVCVNSRQHNTIEQVKRTTETRIILKSGSAYRKKDGYLVGRSAWDLKRIKPATKEKIAAVNLENSRYSVLRFIERYNGDLTQEQCDVILAMRDNNGQR